VTTTAREFLTAVMITTDVLLILVIPPLEHVSTLLLTPLNAQLSAMQTAKSRNVERLVSQERTVNLQTASMMIPSRKQPAHILLIPLHNVTITLHPFLLNVKPALHLTLANLSAVSTDNVSELKKIAMITNLAL
jgi:hypothetical protein